MKTLSWRLEAGAAQVFALPFLFLIALGRGAEPQVPPERHGRDPESYRISVNVNLVVLHATVRDRKGLIVSDLREQEFEVYEDGVRQTLTLFRHEDIPVTVGLVVDHSGSMGPKLADVIAAARTFVQSSNPDDEVFVVNFNENVTLGLPEGVRFTNRSDELERAIAQTRTTGKTALYDAIVRASERLQTGGRDKKVMIVISDGGDNASRHSLAQVLKIVGQSSALVYAIGIFDEEDPDRNPDVLNRLSRATGGEAFFPGPLHTVVEICEGIARDIRSQYTLGYLSANTGRPGAFRPIRVVAGARRAGKHAVRARTGYFGGNDSEPRP